MRAICINNNLLRLPGGSSSTAPSDLKLGKIYNVMQSMIGGNTRYIIIGEEESTFIGWEFYPERFKIIPEGISNNIRLL